ncbi:hypothetical protein BV25DRAFT_1918088 [Artomyces pyxidatus]|uniref:Uncharacterized protein n=1 Tax=Artomyces pyxidatus TaxID=48021 RepID=A0ACB8SWB3_9AGAM|nr:hypothetical protein BV25DRAFT_1918088 [Artomyces pyxidatus]
MAPNLPLEPWYFVTQCEIDNLISQMPEEITTDDHSRGAAAAAETIRAIYRWSKDPNQGPTPSSETGFHAGFIRDGMDRKDTRARLIAIIEDACAALDRVCGVGAACIIVRGEMNPDYRLMKITPRMVFNNIQVQVSDTIGRNPALARLLSDTINHARNELAVEFAKDWRRRAVSSHYLSSEALLLEPLTPPTPATPPAIPSKDQKASAALQSAHIARRSATPYINRAATSSSAVLPTRSRSHTSSISTVLSVSSSDESESPGPPSLPSVSHSRPRPQALKEARAARQSGKGHMLDSCDAGPSTVTPMRARDQQQPLSSAVLPIYIMELLSAVGGGANLKPIEQIYTKIGRDYQEAAIAELGFNGGTARAIAMLMRG